MGLNLNLDLRQRRRSLAPIALVFLSFIDPAAGQGTGAPGSYVLRPPPRQSFVRLHVSYEIRADGTYVEESETLSRVLDEEAVVRMHRSSIDVLPFGLWEKKHNFVLLDSATLKPDGRRIPATQSELPKTPGFPGPPRNRFAEFHDLQVGDVLQLKYRMELLESAADRGVILDRNCALTDIYDDVELEVRAPPGVELHVTANGGGKLEQRTGLPDQEWVWRLQNREAQPFPADGVWGPKTFVNLHITTFADPMAESAALQARRGTLLAASQIGKAPKVGVDGRIPGDIAEQVGIPKSYARPLSDWKEAEKLRYRKLLSHGRFDTLVVPVQVRAFALSRGTRSLMTAELAAVFPAGRTPDPYLVERALGEGDRYIDPAEVYQLAGQIGARQVIWGFAGHDRHGKLSLSFQRQTRDAAGGLGIANAVDASYENESALGDELPALQVFEQRLPELAAQLAGPNTVPAPITVAGQALDGVLAETPLAMVTAPGDPAHDALAFQVLAYLVPEAAERARERFAERSWLALRRLSPAHPDYHLLKARAWWLLGQRPAALRELGTPRSPEEQELRAMLDGNQPRAAQLVGQVREGAFRLMATFDADRMLDDYLVADRARGEAAIAALRLPGETWSMMADRAIAEWDQWAQYNNSPLKRLLDRDFPIPDYTLEAISRGGVSAGNFEQLRTQKEISVLLHVRMLLESKAADWCCRGFTDRPDPRDLIELIEAEGEINPLREARFLRRTQGRPESALVWLARIENTFKGNPAYAFELGESQRERAKSLAPEEAATLRRTAFDSLQDAVFWSGTQTRVSAMAFEAQNNFPELISRDMGSRDNYLASELPFRHYFPAREWGGRIPPQQINAEAALRDATSDISPLSFLVWSFGLDKPGGDAKVERLLQSVAGRFEGSTGLDLIQFDFASRKGDLAAAENYLRKSIATQPRGWNAYGLLGDAYVTQGRWQEAEDVYMSFPGFQVGSGVNAVEISNHGYKIGQRFDEVGAPAAAMKFYAIASREPTGAAGDLISAAHVALMEGRLQDAASGFLECGRHYKDSSCYENFLEMSFALGGRERTWSAFRDLVRQFDDSIIWQATPVGHRLEGRTEIEVIAWAKAQHLQDAGARNNRLATALLREGVEDRIPGQGLAAAIAEIALPAWRKAPPEEFVVQPPSDGGPEFIQGPRRGAGGSVPATAPMKLGAPPEATANTPVKSGLVFFAEVVQALRLGDPKRAAKIAAEAAAIYDLGDASTAQPALLPYFAFAAAKAGESSLVEKYLSNFSRPEQGFNYHLARAVLAGLAGRPDEAMQSLRLARNRPPTAGEVMINSSYVYADICVMLADATHRAPFRKEALDWGRAQQELWPAAAWANALVAITSDDRVERQRAIALAAYLDPQSQWLKRVTPAERKAAIAANAGTNPFLKRPDLSAPGAI